MRKARRYFINAFHSFCGTNYYSLTQNEYNKKVIEFTNKKLGHMLTQNEQEN